MATSFRTLVNKTGAIYDALKTKIFFAEDYNAHSEAINALENSSANLVYKNGFFSRAGNSASGAQNIAHGLGAVPKKVKITAMWTYSTSIKALSVGVYNGSVMSLVYSDFIAPFSGVDSSFIVAVIDYNNSYYQLATVTVDATNIILEWTKIGTPPSANINIMWEVE